MASSAGRSRCDGNTAGGTWKYPESMASIGQNRSESDSDRIGLLILLGTGESASNVKKRDIWIDPRDDLG